MNRKVLFLQVTDPAAYPPIINAASLFSAAGWRPVFLSSPTRNGTMTLPDLPGMRVVTLPKRRTSDVSKLDFALYSAAAAKIAFFERPNLIYASDSLAAIPAIAARVCSDAKLIYHEHDSSTNSLNEKKLIARARRYAITKANRVIFPNFDRAKQSLSGIDVDPKKLEIVWNLPRKSEVVSIKRTSMNPLSLHYHGTITPERIPEAAIQAAASLEGRVQVNIVGYETSSGRGYLNYLMSKYSSGENRGVIQYLGQISRSDLIEVASKSDLGMAFMPSLSDSLDMRCMLGASNKPFDYMAAGLPVIVSDLPDWRSFYVEKGFGFAVNPGSSVDIRSLLEYLISSKEKIREMSIDCQRKILREWNYDSKFPKIIEAMEDR